MNSPYMNLEPRSYWRTGVVERHALQMGDIYRKKFDIRPGEQIATAGSCFAQHISNHLRNNGCQVLDTEPAPSDLNVKTARHFGFKLYSARYGNIYTLRQMLQLVQECRGLRKPGEFIWSKNGRYFDALRPSVEPDGLPSAELVVRHRRQHMARVRQLFQKTSLFIFTMGLTETWEHTADGTVYPTAPGTIAGAHDPALYRFRNLTYNENLFDFLELRDLLRSFNPEMRFILTVSPVPLTATAGSEHVLSATIYSKSVLRAVAGALFQSHDDVDYFPSYEIIAGMHARGIFYENNLRSVSNAGVDVVMRLFFDQHGSADAAPPDKGQAEPMNALEMNADKERYLAMQQVYCEEELLGLFAK